MNIYIINSYHSSVQKMLLDKLGTILALFFSMPIILTIALTLKFLNHGPVFFIQKRVGKNGRTFKMIKFRTMKVGSDKLQKKFRSMNEADGPVFKIYNDPRLTPVGKILFQTGFDEIPQLFNVLKGEMSIVGPRPLPLNEARKLTKKQKVRELVKPGITSTWVVGGSHSLSFNQWMRLDKKYVENASLIIDLTIFYQTFFIVFRQILRYL